MIAITPTWPSAAAPSTPLTEQGCRRSRTAGLTHEGLCRPANEDAFVVAPELDLVAVADGVASSAGGAIAAQVAVAAVRDFFGREATRATLAAARPERLTDVPPLLMAAARDAHRRVQEEALVTGLQAMATTLSVLLIAADHAFVLHVGDSRVHRLRHGALEQLTDDHTALNDWMDRHGPAPASVALQIRHILTRAVSARHEQVRPDIRVEPAREGDLFLLSTDGLTNVVPEEVLRDILAGATDLEAATGRLVHAALAAGGPDNVTAVLFRCMGAGLDSEKDDTSRRDCER